MLATDIKVKTEEKVMPNTHRIDIDNAKELLKRNVFACTPVHGAYESGLPGVRMYRRDYSSEPRNCFYQALIIKMVQGHKCAFFGSEEYHYNEENVLVSGVDMPGASMLCEASPEQPSLSIAIDLDKNLIAQLTLEIPHKPLDSSSVFRGIHVQQVDEEILDAYVRLSQLFNTPEKLAVLGPMIVREIHFLLLMGPNGHRLRSFQTLGSQANQVAVAIAWLKQNLAAHVQIEELAERVHMAPSTFHRHFKEVTTLSPLQYQKRLRLHEAQRLMLVQDMDASNAGITVGYESLSQFNREYKRLFGDPPRKDIKRLREEIIYSRPSVFSNSVELR